MLVMRNIRAGELDISFFLNRIDLSLSGKFPISKYSIDIETGSISSVLSFRPFLNY